MKFDISDLVVSKFAVDNSFRMKEDCMGGDAYEFKMGWIALLL